MTWWAASLGGQSRARVSFCDQPPWYWNHHNELLIMLKSPVTLIAIVYRIYVLIIYEKDWTLDSLSQTSGKCS